MKSEILTLGIASIASIATLFISPATQAQSYPVKPIRLVIGVTPGGSMDVVGRIAAAKMSERMGQAWVVDNKPGASFQISLDFVAKAPADGYTLLVGSSGGVAIAPSLYAKLPYDTVKDFSPISGLARGPYLLIAQHNAPATIKDLVAQTKGNAGVYNYAHAGDGTGSHLAGEYFKFATGADLTPVPFKSVATIIPTVAGGNQVHYAWVDPQNALVGVRTGKLKALVVTSKERSALMPEVPTMVEFGYKDYEASGWFGILGPAALPVDIINRLSNDAQRMLQAADTREKILGTANEPWPTTPTEFSDYIKSEIAKWGRIVKQTGTKVN
ncbi:MAG: Bug family tripartite tricarboxylate transporter substrate binding protein [Burkholderiales bacterium]